MAGIDPLSISEQALYAAKARLSTIAQNVANASTPGYTTKTLQQTASYIGGLGAGVSIGQLTRTVNTNLQSSVWAQNSVASAVSTRQQSLQQLQQAFGTPNSATSFASSLTNLQNDFISLDADPGNNILQSQAVNDAENLTNKLNNVSQNIQNLRNSANSDLTNSVGQVNQLLTQIGNLNTQIGKAQSTNQDSVDLQDQRDQSINQLSQLINISTYNGSDGSVIVSTAGGTLLADGTAHPLSYSSAPITAQSYYPATINGIMVDGQDITSEITNGSMGGLITLRDSDLPKAQAMLDEMSQKLASRFSAQNVKLFTDPAGNVPANTPTTYAGFSGLIRINPAVISNPALLQQGTAGGTFNSGDTTNIENVLNYAFGANSNSSGTPNTPFNTTGLGPGGNLSITLPSSGTIVNYSNNIISNLSGQYSQVQSDNAYESNYQNTLQTNFLNQSAVSLDTEMANTITAQNAYSAAARMMSAVQKMFSDLENAIQ